MSNDLVLLPVQNMNDLVTMGEVMAKSGIMGIKNPADGFVVAATCHQEKMSLMKFEETFHIIQGRPSKKSEAMLSSLMELGGEYEVVERTPERCAIKLTFRKATYLSELTWEDAQQEDYTKANNGKLKDNWSTPRRRMQMMWARVVSDGVRVVCPMATRGCYTPEEVQDFDDTPRDVTPPKTVSFDALKKDVDYTICRSGKLAGQKWETMTDDVLRMALNCDNPNILEGDKVVIREVIAQRAQVETETIEDAEVVDEEETTTQQQE